MKKARAALVLAFTAVLASCFPPPFNLDVSTAARVASKLTLVGRVGPFGDLQMGNDSTRGSPEWLFFPEKDGSGGITLQAGFIYLADPSDGQQVAFIAYSGSSYQRYGPSIGLGPASADPYPGVLLQSAKNNHNIIAFLFNDATPMNSQYAIATGDPSTGTFYSSYSSLNTPVSTSPFDATTKEVIGVSVYPDPAIGSDRAYFLLRQGTSNYLEAQFNYSQVMPLPTGIALRSTTYYNLSSFAGTAYNRVLYYFDPLTMRSYASVWDSPAAPGGWSTWVWTDNFTIPTHWQLSGISNRIDALLTTGEMFSTEGNVGRVFDPASSSGTQEARFSLGSLRFVGETYVGGTATVLFSQALWFDDELTFNVYSIPTAQLTTLDE